MDKRSTWIEAAGEDASKEPESNAEDMRDKKADGEDGRDDQAGTAVPPAA